MKMLGAMMLGAGTSSGTANKNKGTLVKIAALLVLLGGVYIFLVRIVPVFGAGDLNRPDFNWYYYAFNTIWNQPENWKTLYDVNQQHLGMYAIGDFQFDKLDFYGYPPQFAIFWSWLAMFPLGTAKTIWTILAAILYVISLCMLLKMAYRGKRWEVYAILLATTLYSFPLYEDFYWGQANFVLFFLLICAFFLYWRYPNQRRSSVIAGVLLGLAAVFKITPAALILVFVIRRQWTVTIAFMLTILLTTVVSACFISWQSVWNFVMVQLPTFNQQNLQHGPAPWNSSFLGVFGAWETPSYFNKGASAAFVQHINILWTVGLTIAFFSLLLVTRHADRRIDAAMASLWMLLVSPLIELHHMVMALIPIVIFLGMAIEGVAGELTLKGMRPGTVMEGMRSGTAGEGEHEESLDYETPPIAQSSDQGFAFGPLYFGAWLLAVILGSGKPFGDDYFVSLLILSGLGLQVYWYQRRRISSAIHLRPSHA